MNQQQFDKLYDRFNGRLCPICHLQYVYFSNKYGVKQSNIFNEKEHIELRSLHEIDIPAEKFIEIRCPHCGFIMKFERDTLLR